MRALAVLSLTIPLAGCLAKVTHRPLSITEDKTADGIRYYESSLYLLIYSNGKGGHETAILELPDPSKLRIAKPYAQLAKLNTTLNFEKGYLSSATHEADSAVIPKAIIKAAETFAAAAIKPFGTEAETFEAPAPYLFKIQTSNEKVEFIGTQGAPDIHITMIQEEKE